HPFDPITWSVPKPGANTCTGGSPFTAKVTCDDSIKTIDSVDLVVSGISDAATATTRLIHGDTPMQESGTYTWTSAFYMAFPQSYDFGMPAVLIVRGTTKAGAAVTLYVPFSCNQPPAKR